MTMMRLLIVALTMVGFAQGASALNVEIRLSPKIESNLDRIDSMEMKREVFFREHRLEGANRFNVRTLNRSRFVTTEFAAERLFPDVEDFSIRSLITAMAEHDLAQVADHDPAHKLIVQIDQFWAQNYSVNAFNSFNTRMVGTVSLVDAAGATVASKDVDTVIVPQFTGNWNYNGSEYAFLEQSRDVRFAPVLATFLKKGIEGLYPGADVPGPIFIRERR